MTAALPQPFARYQDAARALLMHSASKLSTRAGQFCGGLMFSAEPLTDKQLRWLTDLLQDHGLPALADGGAR